jgi:hypothetical protein
MLVKKFVEAQKNGIDAVIKLKFELDLIPAIVLTKRSVMDEAILTLVILTIDTRVRSKN